MARSKRKSSAKRGAGKKKKSTGFNPFASGARKASSAGTKNTFGSKGPAGKKKKSKAKSKKKPMVSNCGPMRPGY